jgi:4-diphosphocytidyl-2-C-methyl-D-erythritol kinase
VRPAQQLVPGTVLRAAAPAKINLTLGVSRSRRPDGYHDLRGVFARLTLADEVALGPAPRTAGGDLLRWRGAAIPAADDLALRALSALRSWAGRPLPPLVVTVRKRIPVAAGLAGGSSDAAAALRLAARAWGLAVGPETLAGIGLGVGSDVPFFLGPAPVALVEGRGERLAPLSAGAGGTAVLLVCAEGKPSTARIFAAFDASAGFGGAEGSGADETGAGAPADGPPPGAASDRLAALLRRGAGPADLVELAGELRDANDLYTAAAAVTTGLAGLRARVEERLARPALLSGAGPTLFALYASRAEAAAAARALRPALAAAGGLAASARVLVAAIAGEEGSREQVEER